MLSLKRADLQKVGDKIKSMEVPARGDSITFYNLGEGVANYSENLNLS